MTGLPKFAASRTLIAAVAALAAVLVVAFGVVALVRPGGDRSEPVATDATTSSPASSPSSPRMSRLVPRSSAPEVTGMLEVSGPECDAGVINSDLLYPNSGARIIDCGSGWAVMASAVSGDPYWVAYSDGRWRRVEDVSIYVGTCSDEAIARGAPEWMARKHLGTCTSRDRRGPAAPGVSTVAYAPTPSAPTSRPAPATTSPSRTSTRTGSPSEESTSSPASTSRTTATTPTSSTPTQVPTSTTPGDDAAADGG